MADTYDRTSRRATVGVMDQTDQPTHVRTEVLKLEVNVTGGSPTNIDIGIPECGGFIASYGADAPMKLASLRDALGHTLAQWFNRNPGNFSVQDK